MGEARLPARCSRQESQTLSPGTPCWWQRTPVSAGRQGSAGGPQACGGVTTSHPSGTEDIPLAASSLQSPLDPKTASRQGDAAIAQGRTDGTGRSDLPGRLWAPSVEQQVQPLTICALSRT